MAVDDVLDDREAKAGAAHLARAGGVDSVEALGEARQCSRAMPSPRSRTATATEACRAVGLPRAPRRQVIRSRPAVFDGVVEEVLEQLGQFVAIAKTSGNSSARREIRMPRLPARSARPRRDRRGAVQRHPRPGIRCSLSSIRDKDRRSSTSRVMRPACCA